MAPLRTARIRPRCSTTKKTLRSVGSWTNATGCVKPVAKDCARSWASAVNGVRHQHQDRERRVRIRRITENVIIIGNASGSRQLASAVVAWLCLLTACGNGSRSRPQSAREATSAKRSPDGNESDGTSRRRVPAELATFRYAIYVDGARSEVADVRCSGTAGAAGFPCSGRLPAMSNGTHVLEIASFIDAGGIVESARSAAFRVTVAGTRSGHYGTRSPLAMWSPQLTAFSCWRRSGSRDSLNRLPLSVAPDGRVFVGTASGIVIVEGRRRARPAQATDGAVMALALSPTFERDGYIYVAQVTRRSQALACFALRAIAISAATSARAWSCSKADLLPRSPQRRFDSGLTGSFTWRSTMAGVRSPRRACRNGTAKSSGSNRTDGRRQTRLRPHRCFSRGLTSPRGLDWTLDGSALWLADASRDGIERLRVIVTTSERPRRAAQRGTFTMPAGLGPAGLTFYRSDAIRELAGDMFVAGREGGYILRVRFDPQDRGRPRVDRTPARGPRRHRPRADGRAGRRDLFLHGYGVDPADQGRLKPVNHRATETALC